MYAPISIVILGIFMAINLAMLPFAYLMTLVHKALLWHRYKSKKQIGSFFVFFIFGIPMLLLV